MNHAQELQARDHVSVIVYSLPGCVQCGAIKRKLKGEGIPFTEIQAHEDDAAAEFIKDLGYTQAPVIYFSTINGDDHYSGYRPDKTAELIAAAKPEAA